MATATLLHNSYIASLPLEVQQKLLASLTPEQCTRWRYEWPRWARPEQLPPAGDWRYWVYLGGRGAGKTRAGAEWVRSCVDAGYRRIALVAPTAADVRNVMVEDPKAGILAVSPPGQRPHYEPSRRRLTWPNGAVAMTYSAEEPDRLRGPQHDAAWCDELAAWQYPETWDMLMFGLRMGDDPRAVVTTTPRPTKLVRELLADPETALTRGSTYANRINLAPAFVERIIRRYEGTRLGRQELEAELLDDVPGALWTRDMIERARLRHQDRPMLLRVVVSIDPAVTSGEDADETGIVVVGKDDRGHGYVLADRSGHYTPAEWAAEGVRLYREWRADRIVAEVNQGGEMVEHTLRIVDENVSFRPVHAWKGKYLRAEPAAALYEQGRVHHIGAFPQLEDQMCDFVPDIDRANTGSPDRVDALVHALTDLIVEPSQAQGWLDFYRQEAAERRSRETRV